MTIKAKLLAGIQVCEKTGCWIYQNGIGSNRYGRISAKCIGEYYAHRVSYTIFVGPIPTGMNVLHNCPSGDNPLCVNPKHLWLGTTADNQQDKALKGRSLVGEKHPMVKLTEEQVLSVLRCKKGGGRLTALATKLGISLHTVRDIREGCTWKHLYRQVKGLS